jgi:hypothetical protein
MVPPVVLLPNSLIVSADGGGVHMYVKAGRYLSVM